MQDNVGKVNIFNVVYTNVCCLQFCSPEDVQSIVSGKMALKYSGLEVCGGGCQGHLSNRDASSGPNSIEACTYHPLK